MSQVFILSSTRTPLGSFLGGLSKVPAPKLGGAVLQESVKKSGIEPNSIDELFVGNVLSCNLGQNPAKQVAIAGGLPPTTPATLVNKVCCSSLKALILATQLIKANEINTAAIVGTENMSLAPHLIENSRSIQKMGNAHIESIENPIDAKDDMIVDGLWDSFNNLHMGTLADNTAKSMGITREEQDRYAIQSFKRAEEGWNTGSLDVIPFEKVTKDEVIPKLIIEKVPNLRPCFNKDGTITAATSSAIADGAASVVLASEEYVKSHNLKPIARIVSYADAGREPAEFTLAPVDAARKALQKAGKTIDDVDLWEVNEAFACVPLMFMKVLQISEEKVNIFGGGVSIGHPLGCTGVRIVNTLISALKYKGLKTGVATLCNGGGGASAVVIELVQ
ncbi:Acetyl-CoA acetyltransferase [Tritrichomonas foetus]|uniref:acetyl-CoA C-acetyltransferase n=1 Tax=Tritrichomonas foetus TaxID=1144522 RepID=A0A1J4L0H2_9EUKA|nr:Acetyl-CoA acetyltransferase [Tritrichomonas foetus]|eukprot:OHT16632.1 Acetyl-CoA acetyltransferase [Tritrichomonas foetus]